MTAAAADRLTSEREGDIFGYPQATSTTIYAGTIVFANANGYAQPATSAAGLISLGVAQEQSVNAGANGAVNVKVKKGTFRFAAEAGDAPTIATIGDLVYADDDQTVGITSTDRSAVGTCVAIEDDGDVWVKIV